MKFNINPHDNRVSRAVQLFNQSLSKLTLELYKDGNNKFDMSNCNKRYIAQELNSYPNIINIKFYKPFWPWSKALAYVNDDKTIYLNSRKLNRSIPSISGSIAHEVIHILDNRYKEVSMGHGNNSPINKENTAPYWIGKKVYEIALNTI